MPNSDVRIQRLPACSRWAFARFSPILTSLIIFDHLWIHPVFTGAFPQMLRAALPRCSQLRTSQHNMSTLPKWWQLTCGLGEMFAESPTTEIPLLRSQNSFPKLALNLHCGDSTPSSKHAAKRSLNMNYFPTAPANPVLNRFLIDVTSFEISIFAPCTHTNITNTA